MHCVYFITAPPTEDFLRSLYRQFADDVGQGKVISQCFFYADAVAVGELVDYPDSLVEFVDLADDNDVNLNLCSAGFQSRQLQLSDIAKQDFNFKGLGQLIAETQNAAQIKVLSQ